MICQFFGHLVRQAHYRSDDTEFALCERCGVDLVRHTDQGWMPLPRVRTAPSRGGGKRILFLRGIVPPRRHASRQAHGDYDPQQRLRLAEIAQNRAERQRASRKGGTEDILLVTASGSEADEQPRADARERSRSRGRWRRLHRGRRTPGETQ